MRKIISLVLCIAMLISSSNIVLADESTEEAYHTVSVEFSDNIGNAETLQVMIKNDNVYANAEELGTRLGYEVGMSEEYVSIYNRDADENVPYGLTVFYYDSTKAGHILFTQMADSYEAPFETIKNENGVWIPLEYSLLLLNSSMLVVDNTILIDMPSKNIIDIYMDVLKNNQTYLFDWQDDIGISEKNEDTMGKASFVVTMFNGLLNMDGESWVQSIQNFALDSSAYDSKYSEELAMLFCTYSDDELQQEVKAMNKLMSHFDGKGALGKAINAIDKQLDENIDNLLKTSNHLKSQIDVDNNASIAAYNKSYQALENACDKAKFFSDATELYTKVGKGVAEATSFLDKFYKVAEVVGFADEFQNQDKYAVNALSKFVVNTDSQRVMSNAMKNGIVNYVGTLKTDIATYSALRYLKENYDDLIFEAADLTASFGLTANLMLIGWSVMSANIPFYKEGLSNTDSFMLSMYASIFQADSFTSYQTLRNSIFSDVNNITPENLYKISQYCYTYLKFCYITRDAALGALSEGTKTAVPDLIEYQNNINEEIAGYLVQLKNADKTNESKCYGFLPEDNAEYLEQYEGEKVFPITETKSMEDSYNEILERYKEACTVEDNEWLDNLELYNSKYSDLHTAILKYYHELQCTLLYTYYDIDNNGIPELLLASGGSEVVCFDIYIYNGKSAVKLFESGQSLYTSYEIYTNGIIAQYQDDVSYYEIDNINYKVNKIESVDVMELLNYQWVDGNWIILAENVAPATGENSTQTAVDYTELSNEVLQKLGTIYENEGTVYQTSLTDNVLTARVGAYSEDPNISSLLYTLQVDLITKEVKETNTYTLEEKVYTLE